MAPKILEVSSSEFAGKFGQWSFNAQQAPVKVVNNKTGSVLGYFVSEREFAKLERAGDLLPRAVWAWELSPDLAEALEKPLESYPHELDELVGR